MSCRKLPSALLLDIFPQQRCEVLARQGLVGSKDQGGREGKTLGRKNASRTASQRGVPKSRIAISSSFPATFVPLESPSNNVPGKLKVIIAFDLTLV